jgi:hypothetical protein
MDERCGQLLIEENRRKSPLRQKRRRTWLRPGKARQRPLFRKAPPASSGGVNTWPESSGTLWTLKLDQERTVGEIYSTVTNAKQGGQSFALTLKPAKGVLFADLGTQRSKATYPGVETANYGTTVPRAQVWSGWDAEISDDILGGGSDNVGATWGVKFSNGSLALLWYDSCSPGTQNGYTQSNTTFTFK